MYSIGRKNPEVEGDYPSSLLALKCALYVQKNYVIPAALAVSASVGSSVAKRYVYESID